MLCHPCIFPTNLLVSQSVSQCSGRPPLAAGELEYFMVFMVFAMSRLKLVRFSFFEKLLKGRKALPKPTPSWGFMVLSNESRYHMYLNILIR